MWGRGSGLAGFRDYRVSEFMGSAKKIRVAGVKGLGDGGLEFKVYRNVYSYK